MAAPPVMRVFINNIDSFSSGHIAEFLCERAPEAPDQEDLPEPSALQVVGTASERPHEDAPHALEVYICPNREELLFKLMQCDVVMYNISQEGEQVEEAMWAVTALHGLIGSFSASKMFILISTVMTWASSKPVDPDDPTLPFTDEIFWSRKAHLNFVRHIDLEKRVAKMGKTNRGMFSTYVVASGLQYGMGENLFHYFFKKAWLGQEPEVSVFGDGDNILPTIHIRDLARVIQHVIHHRPRPYYLLAVDGSNNSMEEIIQAVASTLGPGKIQKRPVEEALLVQDLSATDIDCLLVNLRMEAVFVRKLFSIRWHCELGLVENMDLVVEEYRQSRGLLPIRMCVLGPPAAGKSSVSKVLCQHYKLHYITLRDTVSEAIGQLEDTVNNPNPETDDSTMKDLLNSLKDSVENTKDVSENQLKVLKDKLMSNPCRNQGFVLDGFPHTYEQAKELFSAEEDDETSHSPSFKRIAPEFVFTLDASDNLLVDRVMNLPESVVQKHKYHQENFKKRLAAYRKLNADEETVLTFFTEMDIPSWRLEINSSKEDDNLLLIQKILQTVGPARSYSPSGQEVEEEERKKAEEMMKKEALEKAEKEMKEAEEEEAKRRAVGLENWSRCWEAVRRHKGEPPKAEALSYLKKEVMPTLVEALSECCRLQPPDPVDFVAEYLVKNNPTDKPA